MTERPADGHASASSLLRNPLPVILTATASFLVVLAMLTARVVRGTDPAASTTCRPTTSVSAPSPSTTRTRRSASSVPVPERTVTRRPLSNPWRPRKRASTTVFLRRWLTEKSRRGCPASTPKVAAPLTVR